MLSLVWFLQESAVWDNIPQNICLRSLVKMCPQSDGSWVLCKDRWCWRTGCKQAYERFRDRAQHLLSLWCSDLMRFYRSGELLQRHQRCFWRLQSLHSAYTFIGFEVVNEDNWGRVTVYEWSPIEKVSACTQVYFSVATISVLLSGRSLITTLKNHNRMFAPHSQLPHKSHCGYRNTW